MNVYDGLGESYLDVAVRLAENHLFRMQRYGLSSILIVTIVQWFNFLLFWNRHCNVSCLCL
jgi:hypothetical protein